jgi:hypothetical protein
MEWFANIGEIPYDNAYGQALVREQKGDIVRLARV